MPFWSGGCRSGAINELRSKRAMVATHPPYSDAFISDILKTVHTVAMVGASPNPVRASYFVMKYLQGKGYRVIPVNPGHAGKELLGETIVASLADISVAVDMVDIFRGREAAGPIVDDAIVMGAKVVWMQLGVINEDAAGRAERAGLRVVMNRCPKMEYGRLNGEMGWLGVHSRVIDNRPRPLAKSDQAITRDPIGKGKGTL